MFRLESQQVDIEENRVGADTSIKGKFLFLFKMGNVSRREFLKKSLSAATLYSIDPAHLILKSKSRNNPHRSDSEKEWNFKGHIEEWMTNNEFEFPWPSVFHYPERITTLRGDFGFYRSIERPPGDRRPHIYVSDDDREQYLIDRSWYGNNFNYACLSLGTKEKSDLTIYVSDRLDNLRTNRGCVYRLEGVEGDTNVFFPIEHMGSEKVFYQVFYRQNGSYKPLSPPRSFKHPKNNHNPIIYNLGDSHKFDDEFVKASPLYGGGSQVEDGLEARFFYDFLKKSLENPEWSKNIDQFYEDNIRNLKNTYHLAQTVAYIIREGVQPDAMIKGGDEIGIQDYRYKCQGLPRGDHEGNSWKLWRRERKYFGILTPLTITAQIEGNHDGGGMYFNPAHEYAEEARMAVWKQPGEEAEGCSPEENYYVMPLANGRVEIIGLDIIKHSGEQRPEDHQLGEEQNEWLKDYLEKSQATVRILAQHRTGGGWPKNPDGTQWWQCYARGNGDTREYYEDLNKRLTFPGHYPPIDVEKVQQPKITELVLNSEGTTINFKYHDHVETEPKKIGKTKGGNYYSMHVGTTNEVLEEDIWRMDEDFWIPEYGEGWELKYLNSPTIDRITVVDNKIYIETICTSHYDIKSNLQHIDPKIGDVLRTYDPL